MSVETEEKTSESESALRDASSSRSKSTGFSLIQGGKDALPEKRAGEESESVSALLTGGGSEGDLFPEPDNAEASISVIKILPETMARLKTIARIDNFKKKDESVAEGNGSWQVGETLLGGKYRVVELAPGVPLAEGGFGVVNRVHHEEWDIDFAVKSPKPKIISTENGKVAFERECQLWIELGLHTNIVTCYMVRRIGGIPRVFAEYVGDGTLKDWISDGRLYAGGEEAALKRIIDVAIQFARGLDHAHRKGLLHLDVKPGNVMMSGTTAKVTDFGLSQVSGENSGSGTALDCDGMTPSYCSPEQYTLFEQYQETVKRRSDRSDSRSRSIPPAEEIRLSRQSDIWSWAISILAMFHGRSPCKKGGQTAAEVFALFRKLPPTGGRPPLPPLLAELLDNCFQKDPQKRPSSMDEVADRLSIIYQRLFHEKYPRPKPADTSLTADSFCNRAISMLDLGHPVDAYELILRASDRASWHPQITFNKALMMWRFGMITDLAALHEVEELAKHNDTDAASHYALGLIQRERGNPKGAAASFDRAIELDAERPEYRKARDLCTKMTARESVSVGRYVLRISPEEKSSNIYVNANQDFLLLPAIDKAYRLVSGLTGQEKISFRAVTDSASGRLARSEDYRFEIFRGDNALLVRGGGGAGRPSSQEMPFAEIAWGRKEDAYNQKRTIRLTIHENQVDLYGAETGKYILSFKGHDDQITSLYVTPDGRWAATGSLDASLRIWQVETGRCVRTFRGLSGMIDAVWIDARHRYVLTLLQKKTVQLWNIDLIANHNNLSRSPMQICVVSSSEEIARRQSALDLEITKMQSAVTARRWGYAVSSLNRARMIDGWQKVRGKLNFSETFGRHTETVGLEEAVSAAAFTGHSGAVSSVALSADGQTGISAGKDTILSCWRFPKTEPFLRLAGHTDWIRSVDLTPDGRYAVSGSWDRTVRLWDLRQGKFLRALDKSIRNIEKVRIASDARTIAVATGNGEISIWDGTAGKEMAETSTGSEIVSFAFSQDGRYIILGGSGTVTILTAVGFKPVREYTGLKGEVGGVALSADLRWAVAGDAGGELWIFDLLSDSPAPKQRLGGHLDAITALTMLSDNRRIVTSSRDRTVRFWDRKTGQTEKKLEGYPGGVTTLASDFGRSVLLTGSDTGQLRYWKLFWCYDCPVFRSDSSDFCRMLHAVAGRYLRLWETAASRKNPSAYYKMLSEPELNLRNLTVDERTVLKIVTEMEYRGFGMIPRSEIYGALQRLTENWPGMLRLV